ncbi:restriction endonuclease [Nocardia vinacea]|uniref:restriction endonuclease n=1 Tax=Nocardia vinacea TaxID=96468 RepID=UPI003AF2FD74
MLAVRHRRQERARDDARVLAALRQNSLSPSDFEEVLAALCRRDGCTDVQVVGGSGDLGADVIARTPDGRRIVLQAKRYRNGRSEGSQDVQRFGGTAHTIHGADVAAVVTTAHTFTPQARAYAAKAGILLMPAKALAAWESQTGRLPGIDRPAPDDLISACIACAIAVACVPPSPSSPCCGSGPKPRVGARYPPGGAVSPLATHRPASRRRSVSLFGREPVGDPVSVWRVAATDEGCSAPSPTINEYRHSEARNPSVAAYPMRTRRSDALRWVPCR